MAIFDDDDEREEIDVLDSWREVLDEFDTVVWPLFASRGYTKDTALLVWHLNPIKNRLTEVVELLDD